MARDTKLGAEEITRDIPNLAEQQLNRLDESGIIYVGAEVQPGDTLVGKVTPKGETTLTPEEKLLRAIFGEKASDVKDTSLRVRPGHAGHRDRRPGVHPRRHHARQARPADHRRRAQALPPRPERPAAHRRSRRVRPDREAADRQGRQRRPEQAGQGHQARQGVPGRRSRSSTGSTSARRKTKWPPSSSRSRTRSSRPATASTSPSKRSARSSRRATSCRAGVLKMVKVYLAVKRRLQPGDKMAGRHGNKGVGVEDRADRRHAPHGRRHAVPTSCLNPLGVPSRMNVGQVLGSPSGLGRQGHRPAHRRHAAGARPRWPSCASSLDQLYNGSGGKPKSLAAS